MSSFLGQLRDGLGRCGIRGERLLVGVSGGADSVALLRGLIELSAEYSLELQPAHLNHGLRGRASDADTEFVKQLSDRFQLPCEIGRVSDEKLSADQSGLEESARLLRHQFLAEAAAKLQCAKIVLAHTLDDQIETVLHHVLRGTGIAGLRGIPAVRNSSAGIPIARPLLAICRATIEDYLRECGQPFRIDVSNCDTSLTRNRLRHVVLPLLREQINPQVDLALSRLAEQSAEVEEALKFVARRLVERAVKDRQIDSCRIDCREFIGQPRHLVRETFREVWLMQNWPLQAMTFEHFNRLADLLESRGTCVFPGQIEVRFHTENLLVLRKQ